MFQVLRYITQPVSGELREILYVIVFFIYCYMKRKGIYWNQTDTVYQNPVKV